jgi:hypothetical protein
MKKRWHINIIEYFQPIRGGRINGKSEGEGIWLMYFVNVYEK